MTTSHDSARLLRIYLQDHFAGATAGAARAARLARAESNSAAGEALSEFASNVASDRDALLELMRVFGVEPSRVKSLLASIAEKGGLLKLNGRIWNRSPLSTIVELEAMQMAVRGKRALWVTLQTLPRTPTDDLSRLIARADRQLDVLSALHTARIPAVLSSNEP